MKAEDEALDAIEALRGWLAAHERLAFGLGDAGEKARAALKRYDEAVAGKALPKWSALESWLERQ